nr:MAG TPA: RING finger protein Z FEVER VIRUS-Z, RING, NEGATIVE [Caudoviricetes sp.]
MHYLCIRCLQIDRSDRKKKSYVCALRESAIRRGVRSGKEGET